MCLGWRYGATQFCVLIKYISNGYYKMFKHVFVEKGVSWDAHRLVGKT